MISTVIDQSLGLEFPIFQGGMAWVPSQEFYVLHNRIMLMQPKVYQVAQMNIFAVIFYKIYAH